MASGWGQGAGLGVGISSAVGMGLGNVVGALLSGVVAIPGVLVGSGVGAIHGPWYKLKDVVGGGGDDGAIDDEAQARAKAKALENDTESDEDGQAHQAIVDAARKLDADEGEKKGGEGGGQQPSESQPVENKPTDSEKQPQQPAGAETG